MNDWIGRVSAGTLGFILGDFSGAYVGINAYNSYQNYMKRKASTGSKRITKRGRTRGPVGSVPRRRAPVYKKRRPIVCKGVKVPRKLAKQIKCIAMKQIHDERPTGKYFKNVTGVFPRTAGITVDGQGVEDRYHYTGTTTNALTQFSVGEYRKIIDAASVLFSTKAATMAYTTVGDISSSQTIIPAFYHSLKVEFRNNGSVPRVLNLYEVQNKEDSSNSVSSNWAIMTLVQKGGTTRDRLYHGMRPEMYPQFTDGYSILKRKAYVLQPGKSCYHTLVTATDHLKFEDWNSVGGSLWNFRKKFTKELLVIESQPTSGTDGAANQAVCWNSATNDTSSYIAVFVKELISMKCPETIDNINQKDNTICVLNSSYAQVGSGTTNTPVTPAFSFPAVGF